MAKRVMICKTRQNREFIRRHKVDRSVNLMRQGVDNINIETKKFNRRSGHQHRRAATTT